MPFAFRPRCPSCANRRFARARRHTLAERAISVLFLPYRCSECDFRFLGWRRWARVPSYKEPAEGLGFHRLGFVISFAVIALSVWSVIRNANEPQRPLVRSTAIDSAAVPDPSLAVPPPPVPAVLPLAPSKPLLVHRKPTSGAAARPARFTPEARSDPGGRAGHIRLRSKGSVVIVASNQAAAQEIRRRSRPLDELIHNGSVFSISNGTAVALEARTDGVVKVRILQGAMAGKQGWVPDGAISSK